MEGRAMFGMLSVLAELRRELIVANTNDGLASARARGRPGGRRPKLTPDQDALAQRLYDKHTNTATCRVTRVAEAIDAQRHTAQRLLNDGTQGDDPSSVPICVVPPAGFEPAAHGLGNRCSIP
jgi:DNA invertase Pin-like site-specific DNA recombinase